MLYAGTFSKVLHPGLALAYLVVPEPLVERFARAARMGSNGCSTLGQAIVSDFLREGHFARHIKKMRLLYARRRTMLAAELQRVFGEAVHIELRSGGMHLIAGFEGLGSDTALSLRAQEAGLNCRALSERYAGKPALEGIAHGLRQHRLGGRGQAPGGQAAQGAPCGLGRAHRFGISSGPPRFAASSTICVVKLLTFASCNRQALQNAS